MSSAKTKKAGGSGTNARGRRGTRGRPSSSRYSDSEDEPSQPSNRRISFTLIYEGQRVTEEDQVRQVILGEEQCVMELRTRVQELFGIPSANQLLFGWPVPEPGSDDVLIRNLKLPTAEVMLGVAEISPAAVVNEVGERNSNSSSEVINLNNNESSSSPSLLEVGDANSQVIISLYDAKNEQPYEVYFTTKDTVKHVKNTYTDITSIPVHLQEWSGWPEGALDDSRLGDLHLDKPIHSLVLIEKILVDDAVAVGDDHSTTTALPGPSNSADTQKDTKASASGSQVNVNENHEFTQPQERIVEDGQEPSTSRGLGLGVSSGSGESSTTPKKESVPSDNDSVPIVEKIVKVECEGESVMTLDMIRDMTDWGEEGLPSPATTPPRKRKTSGISESPSKKIKPHKRGGEPPLIKLLKMEGDLEKKAAKHLLEFIDAASQLSLRRVCKTTKEWIARNGEDVSRKDEEKWSRYGLAVTGVGFKSFETVVNMNLPITRFKFEVWSDLFYKSVDVDTFITHCGYRVKELRLTKFFMFQDSKERALFESFIRLEKLTIDDLDDATSTNAPCPSVLGNLQVLKLNYKINAPEDKALIRPKNWDFTWGMLADCSSLMYFRFPRVVEARKNPIGNSEGIFAPLMGYMTERWRSGGVSIEYLDLKHYNDQNSFYINRFVQLLRNCHSRDIKLKNVHAVVIQQVLDEDGQTSDNKYKFCENVISLINYTQFVQNAPFHNLEKITVDVIPSVTDYAVLARGYKDIFWPKLTTIKIKDSVQQQKTSTLWSCWQEIQEDLYGHNSGLFQRGSVRYIKIDSPAVPYFLSEGRLAEKFWSLRRLEITSWFENDKPETLNKRLIAIWKRLRLEELKITSCPQLNDYSFIMEENNGSENEGSDAHYPFLKLLPTLKKFTLGLDGADGVTDLSFIKVFSRMEFRKFIILSSTPTNISEAALLKMKKHAFGKNIEYFPFHCWSSTKINSARFQRLGRDFRSLL